MDVVVLQYLMLMRMRMRGLRWDLPRMIVRVMAIVMTVAVLVDNGLMEVLMSMFFAEE